MKKMLVHACLLLLLVSLMVSGALAGQKKPGDVYMNWGLGAVTLAPDHLVNFNAQVKAANNSGDPEAPSFANLPSQTIPSLAMNTIVKFPEGNLVVGSNTELAWTSSRNGDYRLDYVASLFNFSLAKNLDLSDSLSFRYGAGLGFGISGVTALFNDKQDAASLLGQANTSTLWEVYFLAAPQTSLDYRFGDSLTSPQPPNTIFPSAIWGPKTLASSRGGRPLTWG